MESYKPSEYWKRITNIMTIYATSQTAGFILLLNVNTVKATRYHTDSCNRNYQAVATEKGLKRRSNSVRTPEFIRQLINRKLVKLRLERIAAEKSYVWQQH